MRKVFSFYGEAARLEYWGVLAFGIILIIVGEKASVSVLFSLLLSIAGFWLSFATIARRCRDAGISPWYTLLVLAPVIGLIAMIIFGCIKSAKRIKISS